MKKIEYLTPETEVLEIHYTENLMLTTSTDETPGVSEEPVDDPYAG